jgi:outer membrane protein TolC
MRASTLLLGAGLAFAQEPLRLSLKQAVEIATSPEGNARVEIAAEAVRQAEARALQARSVLLPNIDASIGQQNVTRNLEAFGIRIEAPVPGFRVPTFVGPFNIFDARLNATQTVFDLAAFRRLQASRSGTLAARAEDESTREYVAWQVARAYLAALKADADVEAARANVDLARALAGLAASQKRAGTGTGIEVTRADVQLANERQRLLVSENQRTAARLQLLRAMGRPLETPLELTDTLRLVPVATEAVEAAVEMARRERDDLEAQKLREATAGLNARATASERLPTVMAIGDYGTIGTAIDHSRPTRTIGVSLRVPVFDGGRREARRAESASQLRAEQARTRDLEQQISLEVRLALDALRSAAEQVKVAEEGLALAENELAQARRRYEAGVTTSLEVTDAQTRLVRARDNRLTALYQHSQARIDFGQATGSVLRVIQ